jgi:hypothetical protein
MTAMKILSGTMVLRTCGIFNATSVQSRPEGTRPPAIAFNNSPSATPNITTSNTMVVARNVQNHSRKRYFCRIFSVTSLNMELLAGSPVYQHSR